MYDNEAVAEIYKNPTHLSSFSPDIRGMMTFKGDLYVMENLNKELQTAPNGLLIHPDMMNAMVDNGYMPKKFKDFDYIYSSTLISLLKDFIFVTRHGKSNNFMLSESYQDELGEMTDDQEGMLKDYQDKMKRRGFNLKLEAHW
jgi:hypothetical protein